MSRGRTPVISAVALRCETRGARPYARGVRADARKLLELLSLRNCELSLVLTGDSLIRELNRVFRNQDRSTDVLSFPQLDDSFVDSEQSARRPKRIPAILGDVVISIDTAIRQAEKLEITTESRLRTLLIHGVLHLLGYDHEKSRADARRMFARERQLLAGLAEGAAKPSCAVSDREANLKLLTRTRSPIAIHTDGSRVGS